MGEDPMSRRADARRSSRLLLAAVGLLLVSSLFPAGTAAAHVFTKLDGNDSRGKLDLRSAAVSHTSTSVVHRLSTYEAWTPQSLGHDSFFVIQIDKNNDRNYERCAFIFYTNRLRGSLSNCGARFIRYLPVAKVSGTAARVTIPKNETGGVYWWGAASLWDGPRPCARGCVDFAPNNFPDILHDLKPPAVTLTQDPLRVWEISTTPNFTFPFSVSDAHAGIRSWTVQSRPVGSISWTTVVAGTGAGAMSPDIVGLERTRMDYRGIAKDKQGNRTIGPSRRVYIPTDDDDLDPRDFSTPPTVLANGVMFGESFSQMAMSDVFTYTFTPTGGDCTFELIGPGDTTWTIEVSADAGLATTVSDAEIPNLPRQTIYSDNSCATTYVVTVTAGAFGLDAVLGS
jgi:hypothetical protein